MPAREPARLKPLQEGMPDGKSNMSRGAYRGIYCSLLDDPDFQRLSAHARHVFLTVRLCAQAGPAAIFRYYPSVIAEQTGLTAAQVEHALTELAQGERPWIVREGVVLWVRNGLRHDPTMRLSDRKHRVSVVRALDGLPKLKIVLTFCDYYQIARPSEGPSVTLPDNVASGSPKRESRVESRESEARKGHGAILADDAFVVALKVLPAYEGVDVDRELSKMDAWLMTPRAHGKRKTRGFVVNWLNRAERTMSPNGPAPKPARPYGINTGPPQPPKEDLIDVHNLDLYRKAKP